MFYTRKGYIFTLVLSIIIAAKFQINIIIIFEVIKKFWYQRAYYERF